MRGPTSRALLFITCTAGAAFAVAGPAQAARSQDLGPNGLGPPPAAVVVGCEVRVDPDPPPPVFVTRVRLFNLTVDGTAVPFDVTLPYTGIPNPHFVPFSLADVPALQVPGPHHITADSTWNLGLGTLAISGDAQCADPPPTTTTTTTTVVAPTTAAPPTTVEVKAAETGLATDSNTASNATEVEGTSLPRTGTSSGPLLLLGGSCIAIGTLAVRRGRRWRSAR
jgi:LPXTG-motif cell wall-anchored protein